jgi:glycosyltransferase involved in cell wall biosynthesis
VSRRNLEQGVALGLFPRERARVIRSGIDLAAFRKPAGGGELRREFGIPAAAPLVVQVACFKPQKAPERFVELAALVARRIPAAHFLLVGDGELRGRLEAARAAAGLDGRLHLPGWRRDVAAAYAAATAVTLTSRFEGLPRAVVEALTAGVPVAAMAVDGVAEVVRDGVDGYLVAEGDTVSLAARVVELLEDPARRAAFAARAGEGLDEFDRDTMVRQQEAMYEELAVSVGLRHGEGGLGISSHGPRSPVPGTLAGAGGGPR